MIGGNGHTKTMLESIFLCAHVGLQQLHSNFGSSVGLGVSCGSLFRDYLP